MKQRKNKEAGDRPFTRRDMEEVRKALESQEREEKEIKQVEARTGKVNREIRIAAALFIVMFASVMGYFVNFLLKQSPEVVESKYNARQETLSEKVVRGSILASDGQILAATEEDEEKKEKRVYPFANLFSHVVGYTDAGRTGLEDAMNGSLMNSSISVVDQVANELGEIKNPGDNVVTTLDPVLQKIAYDALGEYQGACVIMEPDTGKILAMVSKPDFDPNTVYEDWTNLTSDDSGSPLLNRASMGLYPPGSTFKLLTALAYMRENPGTWEDYRYVCAGSMQYGDSIMNCFDGHVHGKLDLRLSVANSCNTSFATLGQTLDGDRFQELCRSFLFNEDMPVHDVKYKSSLFMLDGNSDQSAFVQTAIGQGQTMITPLHNAMIVSAIANGGTMMSPYLVDRIERTDGSVVKQYLPQAYGKVMSASEAETLTDFMVAVINEGTSLSLQSDSYQVAGKTGSAEFDSNKENSHAWFVGFAPADNPKIVVSIVYENGGLGGSVATKGAKSIFEAYFNQ